MSDTKKQKYRKYFARLCDDIAGKPSESAKRLNAANRSVEKRKRKQFRRAG